MNGWGWLVAGVFGALVTFGSGWLVMQRSEVRYWRRRYEVERWRADNWEQAFLRLASKSK